MKSPIERPLLERWHEISVAWADANNAANLMEDTKDATLKQKMLALGEMPVNRAEMLVKASAEWHDYLRQAVEARTRANRLKIEMKYLEMLWQERQSEEANERIKARF